MPNPLRPDAADQPCEVLFEGCVPNDTHRRSARDHPDNRRYQTRRAGVIPVVLGHCAGARSVRVARSRSASIAAHPRDRRHLMATGAGATDPSDLFGSVRDRDKHHGHRSRTHDPRHVTLPVYVLDQSDHPRREGPFVSIGRRYVDLAFEDDPELAPARRMRLGLANLWRCGHENDARGRYDHVVTGDPAAAALPRPTSPARCRASPRASPPSRSARGGMAGCARNWPRATLRW